MVSGREGEAKPHANCPRSSKFPHVGLSLAQTKTQLGEGRNLVLKEGLKL